MEARFCLHCCAGSYSLVICVVFSAAPHPQSLALLFILQTRSLALLKFWLALVSAMHFWVRRSARSEPLCSELAQCTSCCSVHSETTLADVAQCLERFSIGSSTYSVGDASRRGLLFLSTTGGSVTINSMRQTPLVFHGAGKQDAVERGGEIHHYGAAKNAAQRPACVGGGSGGVWTLNVRWV